VEIRRRGHPLYKQKVQVSKVHVIYEGANLSEAVRKAIRSVMESQGVEVHFR
jgi:hypothetical protein